MGSCGYTSGPGSISRTSRSIDGESMQTLKQTSRVKIVQTKWIQPDGGEKWLMTMTIGRTLNVCSGLSLVGDVRLDISPKSSGPLVAFYLGSQWRESLYALKSGGRFLRLWYV